MKPTHASENKHTRGELDLGHDEVVDEERLARHASPDQDRHDAVHDGRVHDCVERPGRDVLGRVLEETRDVCARHDPRHRGEEDGKDGEEVVLLAVLRRVPRPEIGIQVAGVAKACGVGGVGDLDLAEEADKAVGSVRSALVNENTDAEGEDGGHQQDEETELELDDPSSADQSHDEEKRDERDAVDAEVHHFDRRDRKDDLGLLAPGEQFRGRGAAGHVAELRDVGGRADRVWAHAHVVHECLAKPDDVHRTRDTHADKEHRADGPADSGPKGTGDEVVRPTALDRAVGADCRHGTGRDCRDDPGKENDKDRLDDARLANHPAKAEEHDHAEDVEQAADVDPVPRAELAIRRVSLLLEIVFFVEVGVVLG